MNYLFIGLLLLASLVFGEASQAAPPTGVERLLLEAHKAIENGETALAGSRIEAALTLSASYPHTSDRWSAIMAAAWFHSITGDLARSISLSTDALELGKILKQDFMIGRSLCWLGWGFAAMGHYEAARDFYKRAVEIGAPQGKIIMPAVWGLATQELGAIAFKTGDSATARTLLSSSTEYARTNQITIGISEGAAALGEVALVSGNLAEAESLAAEAVQASYECNCNPSNTSRALLLAGKVALQQAGDKLEGKRAAHEDLLRALRYARSMKLKPDIAQALVALASIEGLEESQKRVRDADEAMTLIEEGDFESRSKGYDAAAAAALAAESHELAARYVKMGMTVSAEKLQMIDLSHLLERKAVLHELEGNQKGAIEALSASIDTALGSGDLISATENQLKLSDLYLKVGAVAMSRETALQAHQNLLSLLARDASELQKEKLHRQELAAQQRIIELTVFLNPHVLPLQ